MNSSDDARPSMASDATEFSGSRSIPRPKTIGVSRPKSITSRHRTPSPLTVPTFEASCEPPRDSASDTSNAVVNERVQAHTSSNWSVSDATLKPIPIFYPPLEVQKSVFVGDASPSIVCARISDFFRMKSIIAQYDNQEATAKALTPDNMSFQVNLFCGSGDYSHGVIVEIQQLRGGACPMVFYRDYCRPILRSAQGHAALPSSQSKDSSCSPPLTRTARSTAGEGEKGCVAMDVSDLEDATILALEIAAGLLKKDRMDANKLGMESLKLLTDESSSTRPHTALYAARAVLLGPAAADEGGLAEKGGDVPSGDIQEAILSLVVHKKMSMGFAADDDEDSDDEEFADSFHQALLYNLALKTLVNSLELLQNLGRFNDILSSPFCQEDSVMALLFEIENVSKDVTKSHDAALATRALFIIIQVCKDSRIFSHAHDALNVLRQANHIGGKMHAVLARETERTIDEVLLESKMQATN
mmetsp:Transcript_55256/g.81964  ORF Transcript_55256/g.81964 Transcript_55256/m.81964 type:complete len:473 (+) Transcript_55256:159-1577(+)|eukprot:CAMPEP_0195517006 /NCGR_PEP_ID=MMETSP0794_2-20130614/9507_1 /TAXON_ID=515487 /ORGANISM="Stephanopyxis turris, Strain CCMP 815" /LENGTH=472 /DNA_ID=CAMNT_0040645735 /DNA_START=121 /DNA_END=1539 /DNA_ORIENTATION=-